MQIDTHELRCADVTRLLLNATSLTVKAGATEYAGLATLTDKDGALTLAFEGKKRKK